MEQHATHKPKHSYKCVLPPQHDGSYYVYHKKRKQRPYPQETLSNETAEIVADSSNEIAAEVVTGSAEEALPVITEDLLPDIAPDEFENIKEESVGDEEADNSIGQSNQRKKRELNPENPRSPRLPAAEEAQTTQSLTPTKRIDIQVLLNGVPVPQMQAAFINEKRETLQSFVTDEQGGISASIGLNTLIKIGTSIIIPEKDTEGIVYDLASRQVTQLLHSPSAIEAEPEEQEAPEAQAGEPEVPEQELTEPEILEQEPIESTARNEESPLPQIKPAQKKAENEKISAKPAVNGGNIVGLSPLFLLLFASPGVLKLLQNKK